MRKILIVEDVEYNRDLLVQLLEEEYEIVTAGTAPQGSKPRRATGPTSF
jgi:CheY-like chemotaxis protein